MRDTHPRRRHVGIVGAGIAGLSAARALHAAGHSCTVLDKGRGVGGRTATRQAGDAAFDHGAQYFTVRDPRFAQRVREWCERGVVAEWPLRLAVCSPDCAPAQSDTRRFVAVPGMRSLAEHLAEALDVHCEQHVTRLERDGDRWHIVTADGRAWGGFDAVIVTLPAPQALPLLQHTALAATLACVEMQPCWAAMLQFSRPTGLEFDGAFVAQSPLGWLSRNTSKPGRPAAECWVLHATPDWSARHLEEPPLEVAPALLAAFASVTGISSRPQASQVHRWRYALAARPLQLGCLWDPAQRISAAGDWCHGSRVEGAFLSGVEAAQRILGIPPEELPRTS